MPPIRVDRRRVERILGNLLHNAVKYTPSGGAVQLGVRCDGLDAVRFTVDDEGTGVDERDLDRLFAPAYRGAVPPAHETGGHGLGLSIAGALATAHGGHLVVANRPAGGARFELILPADPSRKEARRQPGILAASAT